MVIIFGRLGQYVGVGVDVHLVNEIQLGGGIGRRLKGSQRRHSVVRQRLRKCAKRTARNALICKVQILARVDNNSIQMGCSL